MFPHCPHNLQSRDVITVTPVTNGLQISGRLALTLLKFDESGVACGGVGGGGRRGPFIFAAFRMVTLDAPGHRLLDKDVSATQKWIPVRSVSD